MRQSIEVELDDLFEGPRDLHADLMVCRVRQAMEEVARELVPEQPLWIRDPELEAFFVFGEGLAVDWCLVHPFACTFLHVLHTWQETGGTALAEAVRESARTLLAAWTAALKNARLLDRFSELGVEGWEEDSLEDMVAARRELVLEGHVIDTGKRSEGQILWAASHIFQESGTWDA